MVTIGAENQAEIPQNADTRQFIPILRTHPVDFEVTAFDNQAGLNGLQFFIQLLTNLQLVDKTANLLPCDDAPQEFRALRSVDDIPKDGSAERFVNCYLDGLKSTGTSMKGKFLLNCEAKFDTFKKNILFKSWLVGDGVNYKTQLDRVELSGTTRITVGKFIYAVARHDFEASFKARVIKKIKVFLAERELLVVPEFAIACRPVFDRGVQTRVYFLITASSADAMLLKGMIPFLYPPSSVETMFLPTEVWFAMDAKKKSEFFNSLQFYGESLGDDSPRYKRYGTTDLSECGR